MMHVELANMVENGLCVHQLCFAQHDASNTFTILSTLLHILHITTTVHLLFSKNTKCEKLIGNIYLIFEPKMRYMFAFIYFLVKLVWMLNFTVM